MLFLELNLETCPQKHQSAQVCQHRGGPGQGPQKSTTFKLPKRELQHAMFIHLLDRAGPPSLLHAPVQQLSALLLQVWDWLLLWVGAQYSFTFTIHSPEAQDKITRLIRYSKNTQEFSQGHRVNVTSRPAAYEKVPAPN